MTEFDRSLFDANGYAIVEGVLSPAIVDQFSELVDEARRRQSMEAVANSSGTYGLRNLTDIVPETADLGRDEGIAELVTAICGRNAFMVRATLFDKTPGANWGVFWHQDLSIAVQEKADIEGFCAWTRKAGVQCVQPPTALMEQILTIRIHLDDCSECNGALKVLPGTHRHDRLSTADVAVLQQQGSSVVCNVRAGGVLLMRPLLLHASSPMTELKTRRVIHLEFAAFELPDPLEWKFRIPCHAKASTPA